MEFNCKHWSRLNDMQGNCAIGAKNKPSRGVCMRCTKREPITPVRDVVLRNFQGAGDQVLLTATVRDLAKAYPDRFRIGVECWGKELFHHNPYVTPREQLAPDAQVITVESMCAGDDEPHLCRHFCNMLSNALGLRVEARKIGGDVHLSVAERMQPPPFDGEPYWLCWFGGHWGFTTKLWDPRHAAEVVRHFRGKLRFVQIGAKDHFHPRIDGCRDLVGCTSMRAMVMLMYHAQGGVGPISFGMHLAAAMPAKPGAPLRKPYVVIAGGREAPSIFQYPNHTVLHRIGRYRCCLGGACWTNHCDPQTGHHIDCQQPVAIDYQVTAKSGHGTRPLQLARCMTEGIPAAMVIEAIEGYLAAAEEAKAFEAAQKRQAVSLAQELLPVCLACPHFMGQRSGTSVACSQVEACCGEAIGTVNLSVRGCPLGKHTAKEPANA